jgi:hypothetical protein
MYHVDPSIARDLSDLRLDSYVLAAALIVGGTLLRPSPPTSRSACRGRGGRCHARNPRWILCDVGLVSAMECRNAERSDLPGQGPIL